MYKSAKMNIDDLENDFENKLNDIVILNRAMKYALDGYFEDNCDCLFLKVLHDIIYDKLQDVYKTWDILELNRDR